jgi:hypothetical protein
MLLIALAAINGPGSIRLKGNLALLSALRTGYVCHLSWGAVIAAIAAAAAASIISLKHLVHFPSVSIE